MAASQPVWFVFSAGGAACAFGLCVVFLLRRPASRAARRVATGAALFYLLASIYVIPDALGRVLVGRLTPIRTSDLPAGPLTIVVLGAGSVTVRDWDGRRYVTTDPQAGARVLEGVRVFRMAPSATVISSGGLLSPDAPGTPTGEAMAGALLALGVPRAQLLVEIEARNTREEALVVARMLRARPPTSVVLVTVGVHMRRAAAAFRAAGVPVIPAIARSPDAELRRSSRWLPSNQGLGHSGLIAHELLGIAYYTLRGWMSFTVPAVRGAVPSARAPR